MDLNLDFNKMKPGAYVVGGRGGSNAKALSLDSSSGWPMSFQANGNVDSLNQLAATVAWVRIALDNRREGIESAPHRWTKGGSDIESDEAPHGMDEKQLSRIDKALMLHNIAAFMKRKGSRGLGRGRTTALGWLNPQYVRPNELEHPDLFEGYQTYRYNGGDVLVNGSRLDTISKDNLLIFTNPEMAEHWSAASPGLSIRAVAQIIEAIDELSNSFIGEDGGVPIYLVMVPPKFQSQTATIAGWIRDVINRRSNMWGRKKTVAVPEGVTIEKLSLTPDELRLVEIEDAKYKSILAAFGVPLSNFDQTANRATKEAFDSAFAIKMAKQLKWIASIINKDEAFKSQGYKLIVEPEKLAINLDKEYLRSQIVQTLVLAGETLPNAYLIAGTQIPEEYEIPPEPTPMSAPTETKPEIEERVNEMELFDDELARAVKFHSKGKRKREFKSDYLDHLEIASIAGEII